MISLILLKLFTFSQILQGVPKLLHATVYNEKYRPTKHRTSCDVTIADAHIAISMLNRYIVQP